MKLLQDILHKVSVDTIYGKVDIPISAIVFDSREVIEKSLFVAQKGLTTDGHRYISEAITQGASAIICQVIPKNRTRHVTYIQVGDAATALAIVSANFYDNPSSKLQLIGVTGTNGKTTVASLLYQLFRKSGKKTGLLSTVKILVGDKEYPTTHTTPDSVTINRYLHEMVKAGIDYCFMEVSSHGIHQKRTEGLNFRGGVFTNLSHDHLDYHKTYAAYRDIKKTFFDLLPENAFALVNADDKNGVIMLQNTKAEKKTYALKNHADYKAKIIEKRISGTLINYRGIEIWTALTGVFNSYNLLAIISVSDLLGLEKQEVLRVISELESVPGRFEYIISENNITAIVDYAHTPNALKNVLQTVNDIRTGSEKLITVVGCGGDRDALKRPKMAYITSQLSNQAIFTADNPRTEDPQIILEQMEAGVTPENYKKTLSVLNRKQAIRTAYQMANSGDIIVIAGKGHETYQEINGVRTYFSDVEEIKNCFQ
ncbi:MAG: UDP-N-acetylmuramoyl-L-alanyl-D-glutamate--2,6-diaminopimelate ligase [Flavobacteriaceae bacterium]|nr:MAG: UDP-N-acetylmuramoyl-L-alanyl-D-glutamate--2,6-diaminopimelate ligase [Flavobacteriaceae bacterium]